MSRLRSNRASCVQSQARLEGQGVLVSTEDISQQKRQRLQREDVEVQEVPKPQTPCLNSKPLA